MRLQRSFWVKINTNFFTIFPFLNSSPTLSSNQPALLLDFSQLLRYLRKICITIDNSCSCISLCAWVFQISVYIPILQFCNCNFDPQQPVRHSKPQDLAKMVPYYTFNLLQWETGIFICNSSFLNFIFQILLTNFKFTDSCLPQF